MKNEVIKVEEIKKIFKSNKGVHSISFKINKGDIAGFVGDNGSGKTTTIKLILKEYIKQHGNVYIEGISHDEVDALKNIAFFPDQHNYPKDYKIVDYAYYCAKLKGLKKKDVKEPLEQLLKLLNLEEHPKSTFKQLSSGMQKRALLLSILICKPSIIILDEPTENLDVKSRLEFLELLRFLSKKSETTILITSHNIDELNTIINKVVFVENGTVIYEGEFDNSVENLTDLYNKLNKKRVSSINYVEIEKVLSNEVSKNE